jgi:uncharacterized protein
MLEGIPLIDAHVHAARRPTLKASWIEWAEHFGKEVPLSDLYDEEGTLVPSRLDDYMAGEGVDVAILFSEYNPERFKLMANLNPHYHHPLPEELERQMEMGAVGLKLHPVHGGFAPNDRALYPAYWLCQQRELPVVIHCGTSTFPGSTNRYADPALLEDVIRDFPGLTVILAHGGRGWWYDAAGFMTSMRENVWIEISGLPPKKLPEYYEKYDFERLARKMIFGTDWPGVPGLKNNALALFDLGLDHETIELILHKNAERLYRLDAKQERKEVGF